MTKDIPLGELQYLLSHGLTQTEIGRAFGVSQQVIAYRVSKLRKDFYRRHGKL